MPRPTRKLLNSLKEFHNAGGGSLGPAEAAFMSRERLSITNCSTGSRKICNRCWKSQHRVQSLLPHLLKGGQTGRKARLVARSRILVQHALLNRLVQRRDSLPIGLASGPLVALYQALAH